MSAGRHRLLLSGVLRFRRSEPQAATSTAPETDPDPLSEFDEYEIHHLAEHLESLGDASSLDKILRLESRGGSSIDQALVHAAWFEAKNSRNAADEFVEDVRRTWRLIDWPAEERLTQLSAMRSLGCGARYALVLASVNGYGAAVPTALAVALVDRGVWTGAQAVGYVRRFQVAEDRVEALSQLLRVLTDPLRSEVIDEAFVEALQLGRSRFNYQDPDIPLALAARL